MKLWHIEYKIKKSNTNKWEVFHCAVISYSVPDIKKWFSERFGASQFDIIRYKDVSDIHGIDPEIEKKIIHKNIHYYKSVVDDKKQDYEQQQNELNTLISRKKKEWYSVDEIINSGNEKKKEDKKKVWSKKDYINE